LAGDRLITELSSFVASSTMRRLGERFLPRRASVIFSSFSVLTMVATAAMACVINTVEYGCAHVELILHDDVLRGRPRILESRRPLKKREDFYTRLFRYF
jgi:hypothetical protein